MKTVKAWYFSKEPKRLRYGDDRKIILGDTHEVCCEPELCERGLHGSVRLIDALDYAPGPIIWRVELSGKMDIGDDKIAATKRTYIAGGVNIEHILRRFARKCALDVANLCDAQDVVIEYLKTGNDGIADAARAAVWDAVWDAAWAAAWAAARGAAWDELRNKQNKRLTSMVTRAINRRSI